MIISAAVKVEINDKEIIIPVCDMGTPFKC